MRDVAFPSLIALILTVLLAAPAVGVVDVPVPHAPASTDSVPTAEASSDPDIAARVMGTVLAEGQPVPFALLRPASARGDELGRFHWGSTVIVLTPGNAPEWLPSIVPGMRMRVGQALTD